MSPQAQKQEMKKPVEQPLNRFESGLANFNKMEIE
jgi:hypothetical protein